MSWTPEQMAESYGPEMFKDTAMSEFIKEWGGILGADGRKELAEHEKRIRHDERLKTIGECRADCYDIELQLSEATFRGKYQHMDETLREYVARLERDSERLEAIRNSQTAIEHTTDEKTESLEIVGENEGEKGEKDGEKDGENGGEKVGESLDRIAAEVERLGLYDKTVEGAQ